MHGINGGDKKIPKADVKLPEATEKLNGMLKKKTSKELDKPTVDDFLPLIKKLKVKLVPIKNGYTAVKNEKGKVLTYLRNAGYGFSIETKNESGNWAVSKVTKHSELDDWVKEIVNRLK